MLNRLNEINVIESYNGTYRLRDDVSVPNPDSSSDCFFSDNKLILDVAFKPRGIQGSPGMATVNGVFSLFWGELYNFDELIEIVHWRHDHKRKPTFSFLACLLYQKYGFDFAKYINGIFSVALRDTKRDIFLLIVDRFGSARPIYYKLSSKLVFSTHLKSLSGINDIIADIDQESLAMFLKYSYIPSPRTIIRGVNKLNPGEMIICNGEHCKIRRYVDFHVEPKQYTICDAVSKYLELLAHSISKRLEALPDQRIGFFLSGGLDSSANVALAASMSKRHFSTFGIGFENPQIDERPYARTVANHFKIPFHDYAFDGNEIEALPSMIWHLEQPFLENGLFLTYTSFMSVKDKADIVIPGNCADQLFGTGGFAGASPIALRYLLDKMHIRHMVDYIRRRTKGTAFYGDNVLFKLKVLLDRSASFNNWFFWGFDDHELKQLCNFPIPPTAFDVFPNDVDALNHSFSDYYQHSLIHQDIEHYCCQNLLVKSYAISQMFGLYERDPYLDYNLVDFLLSLELPLKRKGSLTAYFRNKSQSKYLHRLAMTKILPPSILSRPKRGGFVSTALLLVDPQKRNSIFHYIQTSDLLSNYFCRIYVSNLLSDYETMISRPPYWEHHRDSKANKILYLLTLALWYDIFVDKKFQPSPNTKLMELLS